MFKDAKLQATFKFFTFAKFELSEKTLQSLIVNTFTSQTTDLILYVLFYVFALKLSTFYWETEYLII